MSKNESLRIIDPVKSVGASETPQIINVFELEFILAEWCRIVFKRKRKEEIKKKIREERSSWKERESGRKAIVHA